ncbi:putative glycosyl transferase, group 1 [Mycobacterium xenopi 4042]|uniref:Putative glycosyl transferase, group 1 n=1 Tax=Mycobacterium xenopi 4042 TaxID=1299334 RepID=X8C9B3_MYCXE|nr:putative glycosyl transferase, group 1 [Mycobacterium xenopi 4042]
MAKRLVFTGVHEDVHTGVCGGELLTVQRSRENRCGHCGLQFGSVDPVADHHDLDCAVARQSR